MMQKLILAVTVGLLLTLAVAAPALAVADDNASCIGIGASFVATGATTFPDIPSVIAVVRADLGTQGIGSFARDAAKVHAGSLEVCFPEFAP